MKPLWRRRIGGEDFDDDWRWHHHDPGPPAVELPPGEPHDPEWSADQSFVGEFGQENAFGEGIE